MAIYAALRVPEVWRVDENGLTFHIHDGGAYRVQPTSLAFPQVASADLARFLSQLGQVDDTTIAKQFRAWVRALPRQTRGEGSMSAPSAVARQKSAAKR